MSDPVEQQLAAALEHHRAGRLIDAEKMYRAILAADPNQPGALGLLGAIAHQTGNEKDAEMLLERSAQLRPNSPGVLSNLGLVRMALGKLDAAQAVLEAALSIDPNYVPALANLGNVFARRRQAELAMQCFQRALSIKPDEPEALTNLGDILFERGRREEGIALHRRAISIRPDYAPAHNNLGIALSDIDPAGAAEAFGRAIDLSPNYALAMTNLGLLRSWQGYPLAAIPLHRRAIELAPEYAPAHQNLGTALLGAGRATEALGPLRKAVELDPTYVDAHDSLLWTLLFDPESRPEDVFAEYRRWGERHADPITPMTAPPPRPVEQARRLNVGYVSGDFRDHAVAHFIEPVLMNHDRSRVEVFCYSNARKRDAVTARLRSIGHAWRDVAGHSDDAAAQQIRADGIDVLIDLSGHSALNRLPLFARKPAAVQVTWLGYPNTTGMRAMDYWITDAHLDPPGQTEAFASEQLLRLPRTFTIFQSFPNSPAVNELPAKARGHVTFGSFNMLGKMNDSVLAVWSRVLVAVEGSRMIILMPMVRDLESRNEVVARFGKLGVAAHRLDVRAVQEPAAYLATHGEVDIVLDTFPFTGHTVTLHALWMGCPVVTLAGRTHVARRGVSVMNNLGLPELIAADEDAYVRRATALAGDVDRLAEMRRTMRDRMTNSPLMDTKGFTRELEDALISLAAG